MSADMDRMNETNSASISRRDALRWGLSGAAGLLCTSAGAAAEPTKPAAATSKKRAGSAKASGTAGGPAAKAKAVIQIWLWGGPSHLDTFDPKPEAGSDYCGAFDKPIATNVSGIRICELLPLLAKQADKYSLIRSVTHRINGHETAAYMVQTARPAGGRFVFPSVGAVVSLFRGYGAGYRGLIPPYIVLTEPQGRFSEAGFLGIRYKPFATGGDPSQKRFVVEGVVAQSVSDARQKHRRDLLKDLDSLSKALPGEQQLADAKRCEDEAYELILGDAGKVFDLSQEKDALRDRYGRTRFGQSCLLARRLVEKGVPYITINYSGWDTHKQGFQALRRKLPEFDNGLATLLSDLADHGLLDGTIVWAGGEFGRTPRVQWEAPWSGGRNHWGNCFSMLVAGGGFRGGQVVGSSDARGEEVKDRPVSPAELVGSIYHLMGIDSKGRLPHPEGLDIRVMPEPESGTPGGVLKEIV